MRREPYEARMAALVADARVKSQCPGPSNTRLVRITQDTPAAGECHARS